MKFFYKETTHTLPITPRMGILRTQCRSYSRMENQDPEELKHRKAQFLIYKTLEAMDTPQRSCRRRKRRSGSALKVRKMMRIKIGTRLMTKLSNRVRVTFSNVQLKLFRFLPSLPRLTASSWILSTTVWMFFFLFLFEWLMNGVYWMIHQKSPQEHNPSSKWWNRLVSLTIITRPIHLETSLVKWWQSAHTRRFFVIRMVVCSVVEINP